MEDTQQLKIDLEPLRKFFEDEIPPVEFSKLLDEFIFDYVYSLIQLLYAPDYDGVNSQSHQFIYYLRTLRDVLPECIKE